MQKITKQELLKLTGERPYIFDIGSFDGADAYEFAELGATVHCFEPVNYDKLKSHPSMYLHPFAVGAEDKITVMHCSPHSQSNSIRKPKTHLEIWPDVEYTHRESVEMVRLDTWWQKNKIAHRPRIDLMWVDVNGNEGDFIEGAQECLKITRYLYIESSDKELFEGQISGAELLKLLPGWKVLGYYSKFGNFGNFLLENGNGI